MKNYSTYSICFFLIIIYFVNFTVQGLSTQTHLQRQGINLVSNPNFDSNAYWDLSGGASYDSSLSRDTNTGSIQLSDVGQSFNSQLIAITPGKTYTLAMYMYSNTWPPLEPSLFVSYYNASYTFQRNSGFPRQGFSAINSWQECVTVLRPRAGEVYIKIRANIMAVPFTYTGAIWFDNVYLGEGIGFEQAPTVKKEFNGAVTRVDSLGNVEIYKNNQWNSFFPFSICGDTRRTDWSIYSSQGFNAEARAGSYVTIQKAQNVGMMAGLDITSYVATNGTNYNNITLLTTTINNVKNNNLMDNLLWYYWDNENSSSEWDVPLTVTNKIKELDVDSAANRLHPIYVLQGQEGNARKYNNSLVNMSDVVGTYVTGETAEAYSEDFRGALNFIVLDNVEQQQNPAVVAQVNHGVGMKFRARVFSAISKGAKGVSFWKDDIDSGSLGSDAIPVEQQPWWNDLPAITSEINQMLPIIRIPHWTTWSLSSSSELIDFGTRNYEDQGYIIATNEQSTAVTTTFTLTNLPYTATVVRNFFTEAVEANISNAQFTVTIPAYGSRVYLLENDEEEEPQPGETVLNLPFSEASSATTTADLSYFANDGILINDAILGDGMLSLDGTGDYLNCGNDSSLDMSTGDITVVANIKLAVTQSAYVGIATKGAASGTDAGYSLLYYPSTGTLIFPVSNGSGTRLWLNSNSNLGLNDNQWHTVAVSLTRNGNAVFYVDGVDVGSEDASTLNGVDINNSSRDLLVGSWVGSWYLNGNIDDIKIYKKALTAQEIIDPSESTDPSESIIDLLMDENNEDIAFDISGYDNDGILQGNAFLSSSMLTLDGTGDYLNCGNDSSLDMGTDDMTIVARIQLTSTQNAYVGIVTKGAASGTDAGYSLLYYPSTGTLIFPVSNGSGTRLWLNSNSNLGLNDSQWHTVAVSLTRSGNAVFYVDGIDVGSEDASTLNGVNVNNSSRDLLVGSWVGSWYLNGNIDEVKIYKKVLTLQEISAL